MRFPLRQLKSSALNPAATVPSVSESGEILLLIGVTHVWAGVLFVLVVHPARASSDVMSNSLYDCIMIAGCLIACFMLAKLLRIDEWDVTKTAEFVVSALKNCGYVMFFIVLQPVRNGFEQA